MLSYEAACRANGSAPLSSLRLPDARQVFSRESEPLGQESAGEVRRLRRLEKSCLKSAAQCEIGCARKSGQRDCQRMPPSISSAQRAAQATETDRASDDALRRVIHEHYESVYKYAYRCCFDEDMAAEITVATFATVIDRPSLLRDRRDERLWLLGIARNRFRDARRRRFNRNRLETLFSEIWPHGAPDGIVPVYGSAPPDPAEAGEASFTSDQIWNAALRLPDNERDALLLKFAEQLSSTEVAKVMKCSERTVDRLVKRACNRLYSRIGALIDPSGHLDK